MILDKKQRVTIGFFLIILGLLAAVSVFYISKVEPELKKQEKARSEKLKSQSAKVQQRAADIKSTQPAKPAKAAAPAAPAKSVQPSKSTQVSSKTPPAAPAASAPSAPKAESQPQSSALDMNKLVDQAKKVYGPEEQARKEGTLWVDRRSSKIVVTLGVLQGLNSGKIVAVYDGDQKIGQCAVDVSYDVISYVHPVGMSLDQLPKDYYRAVIE